MCNHSNTAFTWETVNVMAGSKAEYLQYAVKDESRLALTVCLGEENVQKTARILTLHQPEYCPAARFNGIALDYSKPRCYGKEAFIVPWEDMDIPRVPRQFWADLTEYIKTMKDVDVWFHCFGGHGRTGTALSIVLGLLDPAIEDPITWLRSSYCDRVVETDEQVEYVRALLPGRAIKAKGAKLATYKYTPAYTPPSHSYTDSGEPATLQEYQQEAIADSMAYIEECQTRHEGVDPLLWGDNRTYFRAKSATEDAGFYTAWGTYLHPYYNEAQTIMGAIRKAIPDPSVKGAKKKKNKKGKNNDTTPTP